MKFSRSPAWIMPGKNRSSSMPDNPAPGTYQISRTRPSSPSWKIGRSTKCSYLTKNDTPGPGTYESNLKNNTSLGIIHNPSKQIKKTNKEKIGPGAYNPNYFATKYTGSCFSITGKAKIKYQNEMPGPGQYQHQSGLDKKKVRIGTAPRKWFHIDGDIPGPGLYNPNPVQTKNKGSSLGKQPRCKSAVPSTSLGPGQYQNNSIFDQKTKQGKGFTFSSKPSHKPLNQNPAPGYYQPKVHDLVRPSSALKSKAKRFQLKENQNPGPGEYDSRNYNPKNGKSSPSWSYGKEIRQKLKISDAPGPGAYNTPSFLSIYNEKH